MRPPIGVVLAGGAGRRMGGPKEGVRVPGGTLLSRAWNAVAPTSSEVILQGAATAPDGMTAHNDARGGEGPLAGIETALRAAATQGAPGAVVLALDLPRVTAPVTVGISPTLRTGWSGGGRAA